MEKQASLVLIVDDNLQNLKVLGNTIKNEGWLLAVANSGQQALDFVGKKIPDLILLDIMMPEMDGFETCRRIKSNPDLKEIPIIFLTAKTDSDSILTAFEEGAVDYVSKPFNPKELIKRVHTHLELTQNRKLLIEKNKIQNELIHVLCHDLTNPFAAILSFAELIQGNHSKSQEFIEFITTSAINGMNIINLTREIRASEEKELKLEKLNLQKVIVQSEMFLQMKLAEKEIQLQKSIPDDLEIIAEEISLINSVINNLLTNAIKFSKTGSTIDISAEKVDEATANVIIKDYGIGMPEQLVSDLFDITKKTSRAGTNGEQGTGFGMPLVQRFMEKYGGNISVTSRSIDDSADTHGTEICLEFKISP
jgi:two-component system sensor histidine kinase/response regulator